MAEAISANNAARGINKESSHQRQLAMEWRACIYRVCTSMCMKFNYIGILGNIKIEEVYFWWCIAGSMRCVCVYEWPCVDLLFVCWATPRYTDGKSQISGAPKFLIRNIYNTYRCYLGRSLAVSTSLHSLSFFLFPIFDGCRGRQIQCIIVTEKCVHAKSVTKDGYSPPPPFPLALPLAPGY